MERLLFVTKLFFYSVTIHFVVKMQVKQCHIHISVVSTT